MTLRAVTIRSLIYFALMTVITGIIYPLAVTGIAKLAFPYEAGGSIIRVDGRKYGAENFPCPRTPKYPNVPRGITGAYSSSPPRRSLKLSTRSSLPTPTRRR